MGIIRQSDLMSDLEPWISVQKPAEESAPSALDAAWAKATAAAVVVDNAAAAFSGLDKAANDVVAGDTRAPLPAPVSIGCGWLALVPVGPRWLDLIGVDPR